MGKIYQNGKIYGSNDMHAIFNDGGIELTKRPSIQFKGAYSKDDSADNITEVNVIREMTQQEFDQLSSDEKQGLINVVDATDGFNNAFQPVIYSKEEREIGVWIDGKPLYEKTVEWSNSTALQPGSSLAHNIANIDLVVDYDVFISREGGTSTKFSWSTTSNASTTVSVDKTNVVFAGTDNWPTSTYVKLYAVIRYTKTTDTAGSGKWTSNGVPAVHYSTEEHVVGTWVNGAPLYEITLDFSANPISFVYNEWIEVANSPSNVDSTISAELVANAIYEGPIEVSVRNGKWVVQRVGNNTGDTRKISYITIRYTKSST